jgi:hypothetical protein
MAPKCAAMASKANRRQTPSWFTSPAQGTGLMKKAAMALTLVILASENAYAEQVGRYQMMTAPASQSQTFPEVFLLDTATGQSWRLYHETGQTIEWLPLRFWAGKDQPTAPLPPSPDATGTSR